MIIGIDHGKAGGICLLADSGMIKQMMVMPDLNIVRSLAQAIDAHVWIEELSLHPKFSRTAIVTLARNLGKLEGTFRAFGRRVSTVRPQEWQKVMYDHPEVRSVEGKYRSILAAQLLCPEINLILPRSKNPHDGLADSYLIARYGLMQQQAREVG